MTKIRVLLALLAIAGLYGWWSLRRPASPADTLEAVQYTAITLQPLHPAVGLALAQECLKWPGVKTSVFNENSSLLVVAHTSKVAVGTLVRNAANYTGAHAEIKQFEMAAGPQCPVPANLLQLLPLLLLGLGLSSAILFALQIWVSNRRALST